jgi:hypothetical protein
MIKVTRIDLGPPSPSTVGIYEMQKIAGRDTCIGMRLYFYEIQNLAGRGI